MSGTYEHLRARNLQADEDDDVNVAFLEPNMNNIELTKFGPVDRHGDESSGGEMTDQEKEDKKSLISSQEDVGDVDKDGVVREYEVALKYLRFGLFHILLLLINGVALSSDAIEVLSISFVLPVLSEPEEFGVNDAGEAILSSIIFLGMLFGSYTWGSIADIVGRRTTLVCSLAVSSFFGFVSAFSPWFQLFVVLRFLSGFGVGGSLPVIFPYTSEFIRNKYRGPYLGVQSIFWMVGRLLCGAFAWAIIPRGIVGFPIGNSSFHSWRLFIAISAVPSAIGAILYFFLPESPRYLLEVGKQEKAMKALRLAYKLNHFGRKSKDEYPVKVVLLDGVKNDILKNALRKRWRTLLHRCREIFLRTLEMFKRKNIRSTGLMLVVMFCLSFGGYGVSLWYPTYVNQLNLEKDSENLERFCNRTLTNSNESLVSFCDCTDTVFIDSNIKNIHIHNWKINDVLFDSVTFSNVSFSSVIFNNTIFNECQFLSSTFKDTTFNLTGLNHTSFDSSLFQTSSFCHSASSAVEMSNSSFKNVSINGNNIVILNSLNSSHFKSLMNLNGSCDENKQHRKINCKPADFRVYRDSFIVSASALPGNIASAIAVYFLRRNYWLAFALFASTLSVFLLYVVTIEAYVVLILCIFTAVSTPAWNDTSLLIAELYPTHLRSTAAGIHLLMARFGAILGTNIFGLFIRVNPSVPILSIAVLLFFGGVAAAGLPKTTRKTLLK